VTFSQNLDHPKLLGVPLGVSKYYWRVASAALPQTLRMNKTHLVGITFSASNDGGYLSRREWFRAVAQHRDQLDRAAGGHELAVLQSTASANPKSFNRTKWNEALTTFQRSKLIVAPGGLGIETKRPFEALLAGAVPLHVRNELFKHYRDLPFVWVDDYRLNATLYSAFPGP